MKRIRCTFYRPEQVKVAEFENIIGKLEADFHAICSGEADKDDLCRYAKKLISVAKPLEKNPEMLFLGLDEPGNMPSDARVEYFYKPTYLGTAVVIKTVMQVPLFWKEEENARDEYHAEWYNGQWRGIQHALEIIGMLGKPNNHGKRKEV